MCPFKHKQAMSCSETCPPLKKKKKNTSVYSEICLCTLMFHFMSAIYIYITKNVSHKMWRRCDNKITLIKEKQTQWKEWKTETN